MNLDDSPLPSTASDGHAAPRDDVLAALGRRFRGPVVRLRCELRHSATRQVFRRDFAYLSQMLHALEASRRVRALPREALAASLVAVARAGAQAHARLLAVATEMRSLAAIGGQAGSSIAFARPRFLEATIVSPLARDYLALLELADDAFIQIERAWLLTLLDLSTKHERAAECRRALQAVKDSVREERSRIGSLVREVNAVVEAAPASASAPTPEDGADSPGAPNPSVSVAADTAMPATGITPVTLEEPMPPWIRPALSGTSTFWRIAPRPEVR